MEGWQSDRYFCHDLPSVPCPHLGRILVTGASGYIGGRLVPELCARGYHVRVMVRRRSPEQTCLWPDTEIVVADALDSGSLLAALEGVHTAYYLIHSLHLGRRQFAQADIQAAQNFRRAAEQCGIRRIIYLGGLGDADSGLSMHLRNRIEVAEELQRGPVPVTVLRAAVIIGSGSASYEIIRHLAERLPLLLVPAWARNKCQPISIRDVVKYLVGVLETPATIGQTFDIGGFETLTYQQMLERLAVLRQRRVWMISWPFAWIRPCAYLTGLVTPVPAPLVQCLFEGLQNTTVCQDVEIGRYLPFRPLFYNEMVLRAMTREEQDRVYTRWTDAYPPAHELALKLHELKTPPRYRAACAITTEKLADALYRSFCAVGGREGWFQNNWLWRLRGLIDRMLLGVGSARGRRSAGTLKTNDVIDFWRVEDLQPGRRLLLRAEMRLPGKAWLEFNVEPRERGNVLRLDAWFDTSSLAGRLYWYLCLPFHHFIFSRLLEQIEKRSESSIGQSGLIQKNARETARIDTND